MMRGHMRGCRCVGCSPATRAKGMRALRAYRPGKRVAEAQARGALGPAVSSRVQRIGGTRVRTWYDAAGRIVGQNPLTRAEGAAIAHRARHSLREARALKGYPSELVYAGRAAAYQDVVGDFTERRNPPFADWRVAIYSEGAAIPMREIRYFSSKRDAEREAERHRRDAKQRGWNITVRVFDARKNPRRPSGRYSPAARAYLAGEIPALEAEGYPPRRAVAASLALARRAGLKVPARNPHPFLPGVPDLVRFGVQRFQVYGARELGLTWTMAGRKDREDVDAWLVRIKHPLAYQAGTAEQRFGSIVTELAAQGNPLTRAETVEVLQQSRRHLREARALVGQKEPFRQGLASGYADAAYIIARRYGQARAPHYLTRPLVRNPAPWPMARGYHVGDRVTFRDRLERERTGRVVFAEPTHLVLNMGGAHGTPQVVRYDRVVKVTARRNPLTREETAAVMRHAMRIRRTAQRELREGYPAAAAQAEARANEAAFIAKIWGQAKRAYLPRLPNPLMLVNPRGLPRVVATLPASQLEVRYRRHGAHAGDYRHTFKRGVKVYGLADGSVLIRGTKPAWSLQ